MQLYQRLTIMRIAGSSQLTFNSWLRAGEIVPQWGRDSHSWPKIRATRAGSLATGYIMFGTLLLLISRYPCPCRCAKETQTHCSLAEVNLCRPEWLFVLVNCLIVRTSRKRNTSPSLSGLT